MVQRTKDLIKYKWTVLKGPYAGESSLGSNDAVGFRQGQTQVITNLLFLNCVIWSYVNNLLSTFEFIHCDSLSFACSSENKWKIPIFWMGLNKPWNHKWRQFSNFLSAAFIFLKFKKFVFHHQVVCIQNILWDFRIEVSSISLPMILFISFYKN